MGQGWRSFGWASLAGLIFTLGVLAAQWAGWFEGFSGYLLDVRMRRAQLFSPPISDEIVHVDIDDDSTKVLERRWPWDRETLAMAIDEMHRCGARTIVLDLLLDEPQQTRLGYDHRGQPVKIEDDAILGRAMERAGGVLVGASIVPADDEEEAEADGVAPSDTRRAERLDRSDLVVEWPVGMIRQATAGIGLVNVGEGESRGAVRRADVYIDIGEDRLFQLGVLATAEFLDVPQSAIEATPRALGIGGEVRVPLDDRRAVIPWRPRAAEEPAPWVQREAEAGSWVRIHRHVPIHNFVQLGRMRRELRQFIGILTRGEPLDRDVTDEDLDAAQEAADWFMESYEGREAGDVLRDLEAEGGAPLEELNTLAAIDALPGLRVKFEERLPERTAELREFLEGKLVFVGYVGTGSMADFYPTALGLKTPGVCVHAAIANGLLTGHWITRAPRWLNLLVTLLAGLSATVVASAMQPSRGWIAALLFTGAYIAFNAIVVFDYWNVFLALGAPLVAAIGSWATSTTIVAIQEARATAAVRRQFRARVSAQLVDFLSQHPDMVNMDGEERELTIAFTDFVGFTSISEKLEGTQTVTILNRYLRAMTDVMLDHAAYVNKFLGDGIMAFWGAPAIDTQHAGQACLAIVDCFDALDMLNEAPEFEGLPKLGMRAGISTGTVIVGDCGAPPRLNDYTVIGDAVNLAARLESANKMLGTRALVTKRTIDLMDEASRGRILWRPLGKLRVVGQQQLTEVFELVGRRDDPEITDETRAWIDQTREAVELFEAGKVAESMEIWQELVLADHGSAGALLYTERCAELLESGREDYFLPLRSK